MSTWHDFRSRCVARNENKNNSFPGTVAYKTELSSSSSGSSIIALRAYNRSFASYRGSELCAFGKKTGVGEVSAEDLSAKVPMTFESGLGYGTFDLAGQLVRCGDLQGRDGDGLAAGRGRHPRRRRPRRRLPAHPEQPLYQEPRHQVSHRRRRHEARGLRLHRPPGHSRDEVRHQVVYGKALVHFFKITSDQDGSGSGDLLRRSRSHALCLQGMRAHALRVQPDQSTIEYSARRARR